MNYLLGNRWISCTRKLRNGDHTVKGKQTALVSLSYAPGAFPVSEDAANRIFSLPMHPYLVESDQELIIVAGERRFKAAQQVGLSTVPGICVEASPPAEAGGWGLESKLSRPHPIYSVPQ